MLVRDPAMRRIRIEYELAGALATLEEDPARARAMGTRARQVALERFSSERMVDAYLALYAKVRR